MQPAALQALLVQWFAAQSLCWSAGRFLNGFESVSRLTFKNSTALKRLISERLSLLLRHSRTARFRNQRKLKVWHKPTFSSFQNSSCVTFYSHLLFIFVMCPSSSAASPKLRFTVVKENVAACKGTYAVKTSEM